MQLNKNDLELCDRLHKQHPEQTLEKIQSQMVMAIQAIADQERIDGIRYAVGWELDEGGWYSPEGVHEDRWGEWGLSFPEDVQEYKDCLKSQDYRDMMIEHQKEEAAFYAKYRPEASS